MTPKEQRARKFSIMKQRSHLPIIDAVEQHRMNVMREVTERQTLETQKLQLQSLANSLKQTVALQTIAAALTAVVGDNQGAAEGAGKSCDHVWSEKDGQTDIDGACEKCGMSFQRHIHTECP